MDSDNKLIISYAGSLKSHVPTFNTSKKSFWNKYLWTYSPDNISPETRSGYFLFRAIQELKKKDPKLSEKLSIRLWGMIDKGNQQQASEMEISDIVEITGYCSKQETVQRLNDSHVLFLPLESGKKGQNPLFIPGKLYEYLSIGKPILSLAGKSDCLDILERSGLGISFSPSAYIDISEKINWLIDNKDKLANIFVPNQGYINQFDFNEITSKLAKTFDEVLCKNS